MRVVCAWCGVVMSGADGPVSHGICESCAARVELAFHRSIVLKRRAETPRRRRAHRVPSMPLPGFLSPGHA